MAEVTVGELAKSIGAPVERLLKQMYEAGLEHKSAEAKVSDDEKQRLLNFLKSSHGESALEPRKITLQRKTTKTIKTGTGNARKTVNVEVRKKRTDVKRNDEALSSSVEMHSDAGGKKLLSSENESNVLTDSYTSELDIPIVDESPTISETVNKEHSEDEQLFESIYTATNFSHSENPSQEDKLNREQLVNSLAANLAHEENKYHRTIGLLGDWGSGKSTFLKLLKARLEKNSEQPFIFGEFNAWAYEHSENIQAGIAQEMIKALTSQPEDKSVTGLGVKNKLRKFTSSVGWLWQRAILTVRFAFSASPYQLLKILILLLIASIPWFLGWLDNLLNLSVAQPLSGWGYWIWLGGLGIYISREFGKLMMNPQAKELLTYMRLPSYAKYLGEVPVMRENIRIMTELRLKVKNGKAPRLLFIVDDLDRCNPDAIVKVLEAVRLVLELDNVIVIIAVDQQIALAALAAHYDEFSRHHKFNNSHAIARDYLAKIIHLPIVLKRPTNKEVEFFMHYLWDSAGVSPNSKEKTQVDSDQVIQSSKRSDQPKNTDFDGVSDSNISEAHVKEAADSIKNKIMSLSDEQKQSFIFWVNYFKLSNTRQLKRLNNSYDLVRGYLPNRDLESIKFDGMDGINVFPMLLTLILMEHVNSLGDRALGRTLWKDLFIVDADTDFSDQSYLSGEFVLAYRKLRSGNADFDLVGQVESFVLPAVD